MRGITTLLLFAVSLFTVHAQKPVSNKYKFKNGSASFIYLSDTTADSSQLTVIIDRGYDKYKISMSRDKTGNPYYYRDTIRSIKVDTLKITQPSTSQNYFNGLYRVPAPKQPSPIYDSISGVPIYFFSNKKKKIITEYTFNEKGLCTRAIDYPGGSCTAGARSILHGFYYVKRNKVYAFYFMSRIASNVPTMFQSKTLMYPILTRPVILKINNVRTVLTDGNNKYLINPDKKTNRIPIFTRE
ncbi:MAG: hypothetical protein JKY54_10325 [Flavobacteriales bacterium]|nr:hypothetical protein [Flavobacteriales bacterium]